MISYKKKFTTEKKLINKSLTESNTLTSLKNYFLNSELYRSGSNNNIIKRVYQIFYIPKRKNSFPK